MKTLNQELRVLEHQLEAVSKATLSEAGQKGVQHARETKLFKHGNSFDAAIQFTPHTSFEGQVVSEKEYSHYLEDGNQDSGPIIYPRVANALHFFANGEEVFTKHVKAHGPLPFMDQADDEVENQLPHLWAEQFDRLIK